jgi:hypothetical protein
MWLISEYKKGRRALPITDKALLRGKYGNKEIGMKNFSQQMGFVFPLLTKV